MKEIIDEVLELPIIKQIEDEGFEHISSKLQLSRGNLRFMNPTLKDDVQYRFMGPSGGYPYTNKDALVIFKNGAIRKEENKQFETEKDNSQILLFKGKPLESVEDYEDALQYVYDLIKSRKSGKRETKDSRNKLKSKIQESNILSFTQFINEAKVTKPNLEILKNVLRSLRDEKVDEFRTQNDLFVFIEIHKFPHLNKSKLNTGIKGPDASYSLSMAPNNYFSILNYLVDKIIIEKAPNRTSKKIKYLVNQEHLIDLDIDNIDGTYDSDNNIF